MWPRRQGNQLGNEQSIRVARRRSVLLAGMIMAVSIASFLSGLWLYDNSFSTYEVDSRSVTGIILGYYPYQSWSVNSFTLQLIPSKKTIELSFLFIYHDVGNYSVALTFPYRIQSMFDLGETSEKHSWTYRNAESGSVVMATLMTERAPTDGSGFQILSAKLTLQDFISDRIFDIYRINLPFGGSFTLDVQEEWFVLRSIAPVSPMGQNPNCSLSVMIPSSAIITDKSNPILRRDPAQESQQKLQFQITNEGPFTLQYSVPEERYKREQNLFISGILIGVLPAGLLSVLGIIEERWAEPETISQKRGQQIQSDRSPTESSKCPPNSGKHTRSQVSIGDVRKLEKLDAAFLFVLSFVGIIVSFLQVTVINLGAFIEALPFLTLGILLPFYVGYLRGAIEVDTVEERMRGWIYAIIGTTYYFGSFVIAWLSFHYSQLPYVYGLLLMYFMILGSLIVTYRSLKWSGKIFALRTITAQYAFSVTGLSAVAGGFLFSILIAFLRDSYGKDVLGIILTGSPEPFFWLSIIVISICFMFAAEKASRAILLADIKMREFNGLTSRLMSISIFKGLFLGSVLLECTLDFNLKARILWLQSFVFWVLGCFLWLGRVSLLPQIFLILSIATLLIATALLHKTRAITFDNIEKRFPIKTDYMALVFVATAAMLLFGIVLQGMIMMVALTILFLCLQTSRSESGESSKDSLSYENPA